MLMVQNAARCSSLAVGGPGDFGFRRYSVFMDLLPRVERSRRGHARLGGGKARRGQCWRARYGAPGERIAGRADRFGG